MLEPNAYFIVEVLRALAEERGMLSKIAQDGLPAKVFAGGIRTVIERRLNRVPAAARALLELAAVAGRRIDMAILRSLQPQLDAWLETCANLAVLEASEQGWRFTHEKLRERLLEDLTPEHRRSLQLQVGEALERLSQRSVVDPSRLAYHYGEAGVASKAIYYATLAGESALREGAIDKALSFFDEVLALEATVSTKTLRGVRAQRLAGVALLALGRLPESVSRFSQAFALLGLCLPTVEDSLGPQQLDGIAAEVNRLLAAPLLANFPLERPIQVAKETVALAANCVTPFLSLERNSSAHFVCLLGIGLAQRFGLPKKAEFFTHLRTDKLNFEPLARLAKP